MIRFISVIRRFIDRLPEPLKGILFIIFMISMYGIAGAMEAPVNP